MFAHDMGNRYVFHCRAVKAQTVRNIVWLSLVTTLHTSGWTILQCIGMQSLFKPCADPGIFVRGGPG